MSSLARRIQIRIWKRQGRKRFDHNAAHGGKVKVFIPEVEFETERSRFAWPLLSPFFNPTA